MICLVSTYVIWFRLSPRKMWAYMWAHLRVGGILTMLTEIKAKRIKSGDKPLADGQITGLRLIPVRDGAGKWQLRYVSPTTAKRRDMGLGGYPEVSIAEVRKRALVARSQISDGIDPVDHRLTSKQSALAQIAALTFEQAARRVHECRKAGWLNAKHSDQWINTLATYVFPFIGNRPVDTLKTADFAAVLQPIWLSKFETARRVKQRCHAVMKWCWGNEMVQANPVDMVDMILSKQGYMAKKKAHYPAMPWRVVSAFVTEVIYSGDDVARHLLEFTILTAARSGEARGMTWEEVDLDTAVWTVPAGRMKAKVAHRVPLSARAVEILKQRRHIANHPELVFPSPRGKVLTHMAMIKFLHDHKAQSDVVDRVATAHGFRSSFRDWASENGVQRDLAERALAHTIQNAVEAAYHRTDLLEQRRSVMEAWAAHVTGAAVTGNVVALARRV
jgi:integrase